MTSALVVLVLVGAHDGGEAATAAIRRAMVDALRDRAEVVIRSVDRLPTDDQALDEARDAHAAVLAEVGWSDEPQAQASVHVHIAGMGGWLDRRIGFSASDAPAERGRTVGFAIASVMPEATAGGAAPSPTPPTPAPLIPPPSAVQEEPRAPPPAEAPKPPPAAPGAVPSFQREAIGAVDLSLVGAWGGAADGGGVEIGGERRWRSVSARAALQWRTGDITAAQVRTLMLSFAPGIAWRPIEPTESTPFGVGLRAGYLIVREQLTRPIDGASPPARWQSGAQALVEGVWQFARGALAVVAIGGETTFGTLDVVVGGRTVTSIEPLRLLAEGGIRARF